MLFSRGIRPEAQRDLTRILGLGDELERELIEECSRLLFGVLRYDHHLQGIVNPQAPFQAMSCGLLRVIFRVAALDDRYVEIWGFVRNPNWVP
jgi:hypothetical protein